MIPGTRRGASRASRAAIAAGCRVTSPRTEKDDLENSPFVRHALCAPRVSPVPRSITRRGDMHDSRLWAIVGRVVEYHCDIGVHTSRNTTSATIYSYISI